MNNSYIDVEQKFFSASEISKLAVRKLIRVASNGTLPQTPVLSIKQSNIIELLILNVPLPPIIMIAKEDGSWLTISRHEIISAIIKFIPTTSDNSIAIPSLGRLPLADEYSHKTFFELPVPIQRRITRCQVPAYLIPATVPGWAAVHLCQSILDNNSYVESKRLRQSIYDEVHEQAIIYITDEKHIHNFIAEANGSWKPTNADMCDMFYFYCYYSEGQSSTATILSENVLISGMEYLANASPRKRKILVQNYSGALNCVSHIFGSDVLAINLDRQLSNSAKAILLSSLTAVCSGHFPGKLEKNSSSRLKKIQLELSDLIDGRIKPDVVSNRHLTFRGVITRNVWKKSKIAYRHAAINWLLSNHK